MNQARPPASGDESVGSLLEERRWRGVLSIAARARSGTLGYPLAFLTVCAAAGLYENMMLPAAAATVAVGALALWRRHLIAEALRLKGACGPPWRRRFRSALILNSLAFAWLNVVVLSSQRSIGAVLLCLLVSASIASIGTYVYAADYRAYLLVLAALGLSTTGGLLGSPVPVIGWVGPGVALLVAYLAIAGKELHDELWRAIDAGIDLELYVQEIARRRDQLQDRDRELAQRRAEETRLGSRLLLLERAVETMSLGLTITDDRGSIAYTNEADARMHGWQPAELIGRPASIFRSRPSDTTEVAPASSGQPWMRERANVTREGRVFPARLVSDRVNDAQGNLIGTVTLCEDVSESYATRLEIERRDRVLSGVAAATEALLSEASWEDGLREFLAALSDATGSTIDLHRETGSQAFPSRWPPGAAPMTSPATPRTPAEPGELVLLVRVGGLLWGSLAFRRDGAAADWLPSERAGLAAAARTLGAAVGHQLAQSALAKSEGKYRELIESASDLIQSVSAAGRLLFVNQAWREALGYSEEEASQLQVEGVLRPDQREGYRLAHDELLVSGESRRLELSLITESGREIAVEGLLSCRREEGRPVAILGVFRDISERREVERLKHEFLSTISHELRTPLTSIIGAIELVRDHRVDRRSLGELLEIAHRNSERLLNLINDLLDLQKLASGALFLDIRDHDASAVVLDAVSGIEGLSRSLQVTVRAVTVTDGLLVRTDRHRLLQILNNLLANAIRFSPAGETVLVKVEAAHDGIAFEVTDRGPGIPEALQARVFDRFIEADGLVPARTKGSGLGLSIVSSLADRLGGTIHLASQVGAGSTFRLILPTPAQTEATPAKTEA